MTTGDQFPQPLSKEAFKTAIISSLTSLRGALRSVLALSFKTYPHLLVHLLSGLTVSPDGRLLR